MERKHEAISPEFRKVLESSFNWVFRLKDLSRYEHLSEQEKKCLTQFCDNAKKDWRRYGFLIPNHIPPRYNGWTFFFFRNMEIWNYLKDIDYEKKKKPPFSLLIKYFEEISRFTLCGNPIDGREKFVEAYEKLEWSKDVDVNKVVRRECLKDVHVRKEWADNYYPSGSIHSGIYFDMMENPTKYLEHICEMVSDICTAYSEDWLSWDNQVELGPYFLIIAEKVFKVREWSDNMYRECIATTFLTWDVRDLYRVYARVVLPFFEGRKRKKEMKKIRDEMRELRGELQWALKMKSFFGFFGRVWKKTKDFFQTFWSKFWGKVVSILTFLGLVVWFLLKNFFKILSILL